MTFKAKRDSFFTNVFICCLVLVAAATLWPVVYELFFAKETDWTGILIMGLLFIVTVGFLLWIWIDIEYTFHPGYLLVRGGPIRSRIPYEQITKVRETQNIFIGYRILSSSDAVEIFYKSGLWGSVIISPENKLDFMDELRRRCPDL